MFYSERKAEDFLEENGFSIVKRGYAKDKEELEKLLKKLTFPIVMKVSGEKIVHKNALGGIVISIKNKKSAFRAFNKLTQISGFDGVMVQEQLRGKEVLIGVKKTADFGHVVCFGSGGVNTERMKDVSFRIFPFDKKDVEKMILETKISRNLGREEKKAIEKNLIKVCELIKKNPNISELDINPLIVKKSRAIVVDARIVFG